MEVERLDTRLHYLAAEVIDGLRDCQASNPQATFIEIEAALDERIERARARTREAAQASDGAGSWLGGLPGEGITVRCGGPVNDVFPMSIMTHWRASCG